MLVTPSRSLRVENPARQRDIHRKVRERAQAGRNSQNLVCELRPACARSRTFLWMSLCLAGFSTRKDLLGVTSIVRALGLEPACYDRLLDFFHSPALDLDKLTRAWCALVFRLGPGILRVNLKPVLVGDGIKVAKA